MALTCLPTASVQICQFWCAASCPFVRRRACVSATRLRNIAPPAGCPRRACLLTQSSPAARNCPLVCRRNCLPVSGNARGRVVAGCLCPARSAARRARRGKETGSEPPTSAARPGRGHRRRPVLRSGASKTTRRRPRSPSRSRRHPGSTIGPARRLATSTGQTAVVTTQLTAKARWRDVGPVAGSGVAAMPRVERPVRISRMRAGMPAPVRPAPVAI